jgi:hypothetical protein
VAARLRPPAPPLLLALLPSLLELPLEALALQRKAMRRKRRDQRRRRQHQGHQTNCPQWRRQPLLRPPLPRLRPRACQLLLLAGPANTAAQRLQCAGGRAHNADPSLRHAAHSACSSVTMVGSHQWAGEIMSTDDGEGAAGVHLP